MSIVANILRDTLACTLKSLLGHEVKLRYVVLAKSRERFPIKSKGKDTATSTVRGDQDDVRSSSSGSRGSTYSSSEKFYLCMGEHAFYLVSHDMKVVYVEGGIAYNLLDKVITDDVRENLFEIKLKKPGAVDMAGNYRRSLYLISFDRDAIVQRLQIYWRTHCMYTTWKVPDMTKECRVEKGRVGGGGGGAGTEFFSRAFKDCPEGEVEFDVGNYRFWIDDSFVAGSRPGHYRSRQKYGRLTVQVKPSGSIIELKRSRLYSIKSVADEEVQRIASLVKEYVFVSTPKFYRKKYNLTHDQAQWTAWVAHMRTGRKRDMLDPKMNKSATICQQRDVVIVAARRKYIPPLMASYQDFVFTMYAKSRHKLTNDADIMKRGEATFRMCTSVYDSLRTKSLQDFDYDFNVLQTKADTLWLDNDAMQHFQATLLLQSSGYYRARRFVLSVLRVMYKMLEQPRYQLEDGEEAGTDEDPFYHADELIKRTQGLTQQSKRVHYDRWRVRVWNYLAYCVDGNLRDLTSATISIEDIAAKTISAGQEHRSEQRKLSTILDHLLHFRLKGSNYRGDSVVDVFDRAGLMDEFAFNENVFVKLLKANYFVRFVFAKGEWGTSRAAASKSGDVAGARDDALVDEPSRGASSDAFASSTTAAALSKYPSFLVRILRQCTETPARMAVTMELQAGICLQLLQISNIYKEYSVGGRSRSSIRAADEVAVLIVLPEVVKLLRKHTDDVIKTHLMATLVNFTYGNEHKKKEVMRHDMPSIANHCLRSQDPDLVRQSCMLLSNLTTSKTGCKAVAMVSGGEATTSRSTEESVGDSRTAASRGGGGSVMYNLAMLLNTRPFPPHSRSVIVRYEAMKVLQNLSKDQTLHSAMVDCLPKTMRGSAGELGSVFLRKLADILKERKSRSGSDNRKVKHLLMCVCTCLTRLCYKHNERKKTVGRMTIELLVKLLSDDISKQNPDLTIKILMLCCSLAFDPYNENLSRFKKSNLNKTLNEVKLHTTSDKQMNPKHRELIEKLIMDIHKAQKKGS